MVKLRATDGRVLLPDAEPATLRDWLGANRTGLDGIDLSGLRLAGLDLSGARLRGADLTGADLADANLERADLTGAVLDRANLARCNLRGVQLADARAIGVVLENADASGARLDRTDLSGCDAAWLDLTNAVMAGTRFDGADLHGAYLDGVDATGTDFRRSTLSAATFHGATLTGCDFAGATFHDPADARSWRLSGDDRTAGALVREGIWDGVTGMGPHVRAFEEDRDAIGRLKSLPAQLLASAIPDGAPGVGPVSTVAGLALNRVQSFILDRLIPPQVQSAFVRLVGGLEIFGRSVFEHVYALDRGVRDVKALPGLVLEGNETLRRAIAAGSGEIPEGAVPLRWAAVPSGIGQLVSCGGEPEPTALDAIGRYRAGLPTRTPVTLVDATGRAGPERPQALRFDSWGLAAAYFDADGRHDRTVTYNRDGRPVRVYRPGATPAPVGTSDAEADVLLAAFATHAGLVGREIRPHPAAAVAIGGLGPAWSETHRRLLRSSLPAALDGVRPVLETAIEEHRRAGDRRAAALGRSLLVALGQTDWPRSDALTRERLMRETVGVVREAATRPGSVLCDDLLATLPALEDLAARARFRQPRDEELQR